LKARDSRTAAPASHHTARIGAEQIVFHRRPVRTNHDQLDTRFLGDVQDHVVNAFTVLNDNLRDTGRSILMPDSGLSPAVGVG